MQSSRYNDGIHQYRKPVGDSWKYLIGYKVQGKDGNSGYSRVELTRQVENVVLGCYLIQFDDGMVEISEEFIYEIHEEDN